MNKAFYVCVTGTPSDPEDAEVQGVYLASVLGDTDDTGQIAGAILDEFHDNVAIAALDDFEITVLDEDGTEIFQAEDYEERSMQHIADFQGSISPEDATDAVQDYLTERLHV